MGYVEGIFSINHPIYCIINDTNLENVMEEKEGEEEGIITINLCKVRDFNFFWDKD